MPSRSCVAEGRQRPAQCKLSHSHAHSLAHSHTHSHTHSLAHAYACPHRTHSPACALTRPHAHSKHARTLARALAGTLTCTHTRTHAHTHARSLTCMHIYMYHTHHARAFVHGDGLAGRGNGRTTTGRCSKQCAAASMRTLQQKRQRAKGNWWHRVSQRHHRPRSISADSGLVRLG